MEENPSRIEDYRARKSLDKETTLLPAEGRYVSPCVSLLKSLAPHQPSTLPRLAFSSQPNLFGFAPLRQQLPYVYLLHTYL